MSIQSSPKPSTSPHQMQGDLDHRSRSELTTEVLTEARTADEDRARELRARVVVLHLDVAESVAWRYRSRGQDHQDLVQVARLGLIEAAERFDPDRGPFLAYAVPTMVGHVKRHFRDHGWVVRPPRQIQEKQAEIARAKDDLTHVLRRRPSSADLATYLGMTAQEVQEAEDIEGCFHPASLDAALAHSANDLNGLLGEKEAQLDSIEALATVSPACRQLPENERRLLYLRFFKLCSQEEIAAEFGISQMQVSRWLRRTLTQLRETIGDMDPSDAPAGAGDASARGVAAAPTVRGTNRRSKNEQETPALTQPVAAKPLRSRAVKAKAAGAESAPVKTGRMQNGQARKGQPHQGQAPKGQPENGQAKPVQAHTGSAPSCSATPIRPHVLSAFDSDGRRAS